MESNTPEFRFNGFDEDWEELEINSVAEMNPKNDIPTTFNYVDLESVVGTEMNTYRKEFRDSAPSRAQRLAKKGDIFYQTVRPYQKNNYLFDKNENDFVFSTGYAQLRPKNDSYFLFSLIQSYDFVKIIMDNCTGTSYPAISSTSLAKIKRYFPKPEEQKKIGNFFENLDKLLTEHQQKHSKLKVLKKAMLSKMFPQQGQTVPEIRFKGFSGDWEQIKLGDKVPVRGGFAFISTSFRKKGIPILKISNILPSGEVGGNFDYYNEIEQDINVFLPNKSAVIAMSGATTGKVSILKISENEKIYQNQRVGYFENKNFIDYTFICTLVKSSIFERKLKSVLVAGAQPNVSPKEIDSFEFLIPKDKEEQSKIGNYFINLDELIINYDIQITKFQNIKKAFLAKMFI